ncbi:GtrA family protein [Tardiphaga sp.]|jgi:putative flippase GtrA|uniref:GtrA family protein n=1 Tax=Tardiphaga sp. TaxID=1926292 RepID=UPI0025DA9021|nr:GtrA family protein [Tardiphaga sp.]
MKLFLPAFVETRLSHPMVAKMISFGVIGLGNTVVDLAIFSLAYEVLKLPLVPANVLAWLVAVSGSYVMNTLITFRAESGRVLRRKDYLSFVGSGVLGVIVTTTILVVLSNFMPVLFAKLVAIVASFVVNFTMSHFVVFRTKPPIDEAL